MAWLRRQVADLLNPALAPKGTNQYVRSDGGDNNVMSTERQGNDPEYAIKTLERRTSESLIEIGKHLIAVKDALPHGQFGPWLEAEFGWSQDTAGRFMSVARAFRDIPQIAEFQSSALYALASGNVPEEIREQFIKQAEAGEPVTRSGGPETAKRAPLAVTPVRAV